MALPAKVTDINTARWSDHLNSYMRPVQRLRTLGLSAGEDAQRSLGDSATNEAWGQKVDVNGNTYIMVMVKIQKVGSPTDGIVAKLYNSATGNPGTLIATSTQVKATQLSTSSRWARLYFLVPAQFSFTMSPHVAIFRTGAFDASNYYKIGVDSTNSASASNAETRLSGGTWSTNDSARLMLLLHYAPTDWYTFAPGVDNKLHCYMSSDSGQTWAEQDSANAPSIISTSGFRSISVQGVIGGDQVRVAKINSTSQAAVTSFWGDNSNSWIGDSSVTISAPATNVSGQCPIFGFSRFFSSGTDRNAIVYQGPAETIMGSGWRRIKISLTSSTVTYDVIGSANTPSSTLPGTQIHYDLRVAHMDDFGNIYIWYTQSDDSLLRLRIFKTNDTFCTILNPGTASSSNSAAYPVGLAINFWRNGEAYVGLPYVDGSATKVMTSKAGTDAETAGNWTVATAVASAAEVTTSNPATLVADNEAGGRLFLFRRRTDGTLGISDDGGTGTWTAEVNFRSGQSIAGLSAGALLNPSEIGVTYLNTTPTPDEIQHDHL